MTITWWMWMLAGLLLLVVELLTPGGFFALFFGCGAIAVGLLSVAGLKLPLIAEGIIFLALSVLALAALRKPLMAKFHAPAAHKAVDSMVGEFATAMEEIPAGGLGKAELRGSAWTLQNAGDGAISKAQRVRVDKVDGLTLVAKG